MLPCCTCIFCWTLSKQVADVMVLYPEYFRVPSQERHFPTWDSQNTSQIVPGPSAVFLLFKSLSPISQHLFVVVYFFPKHIAFYNYVSSFYSRIAPFFFHSLLHWPFFFFFWYKPRSAFVRLFPCGGVWFVPKSGPCIPWKLETI